MPTPTRPKSGDGDADRSRLHPSNGLRQERRESRPTTRSAGTTTDRATADGARESAAEGHEHPLVRLQRSGGNQAVQRLVRDVVQPSLRVGPADDAYEREADDAARRVSTGGSVPEVRQLHPGGAQRQALEEEREEEPASSAPPEPSRVPPRRRDAEEGEPARQASGPGGPAPAVGPGEAAERARTGRESGLTPEEEPAVPTPTAAPPETEEEREELVQPKVSSAPATGRGVRVGWGAGSAPGSGPAAVRATTPDVSNPSGGGEPLSAGTRRFFEDRFGRGFGDVRVHTGRAADAAARALDAEAFTHGRDVYFRSGRYRPDTSDGQRLLAHELTHTIQQRPARTPRIQERPAGTRQTGAQEPGVSRERAGPTRPPTRPRSPPTPRVTPPGSRLEREADATAAAVARGDDVRSRGLTAATAPAIARQVAGSAPTGGSPADAVQGPAAGDETLSAAEQVELKGASTFDPPTAVADRLAETRRPQEVPVTFGSLARGRIRVRRRRDRYDTPRPQPIELTHPALSGLQGADVRPVMVVTVDNGSIGGYVSVASGRRAVPRPRAITRWMEDNPALLGWAGMDDLGFDDVQNTIENGTLLFQVQNFGFRLGGFLRGTGRFGLQNEAVTFGADADVDVPKLSTATLHLERDERGELRGNVQVPVQLASFSGNLLAEYGNGTVAIEGTVSYASEKLSGELTLLVTDAETARNVARDVLPPDAIDQSAETAAGGGDSGGAAGAAGGGTAGGAGGGGAPPVAAAGPTPGPRAVAGHGTLQVQLTPWLTGRAQVVVDNEGHVTVVGELQPPAEVPLFQQKDYAVQLAELKVKALYGLPVVGNVNVFASIGLTAEARLGPATLKDIEIKSRYSTDPRVFNDFRLAATVNISAFAGLRLRAEGGVGITIVAHDIEAGVGVNATAGIRGYAEARPTIGYREKASPEEGKQGEFFIKGHMEIAAQPFLGLGGDLFVRVDAPWVSPVPDKTWTWPLGQLEYPLPGQFGIAADVDHVVGSGTVPDVKFGEVNFDRTKFMTDLLRENVPRGRKEERETQGTFEDRAEPPSPTGPVPRAEGPAGGRGRGQVAEAPRTRSPGGGPSPAEPARGGRQTGGRGRARDQYEPPEGKREQWLQGTMAVRRLTEDSRAPFDQQEITAALRAIKRRYGFRVLDAELVGGAWAVEAAMSPGRKIAQLPRDPNETETEAGPGEEEAGRGPRPPTTLKRGDAVEVRVRGEFVRGRFEGYRTRGRDEEVGLVDVNTGVRGPPDLRPVYPSEYGRQWRVAHDLPATPGEQAAEIPEEVRRLLSQGNEVEAKFKTTFERGVVRGFEPIGGEQRAKIERVNNPGSIFVTAADYNVKFRRVTGASLAADAEFERQKTRDRWSSFDVAREVLNYRYSKRRSDGRGRRNPVGKQWHHIVEQTAAGPNAVENLAIAPASVNADLNTFYGRAHSGFELGGRRYQGTGGQPLREYLGRFSGQGVRGTLHYAWGIHAIRTLGHRIETISTDEGPFQEIP
jgi:hypothetical protein